MKTYQILARAIGARNRCIDSKNDDWTKRHQDRINSLLENFPHGSGFDIGTQLDESSTPEKLVFNTAFHHMDENGCYDGWTEHQVIVTPSLELEFSLRITGRDRNGIKEVISDYFNHDLDREETEYAPDAVEANT